MGTAIFFRSGPALSNLVKKKTKFLVIFAYFVSARFKSKETIVGIKVVYGTYKHFRSVRYEKWSYYWYFIAVKPFQTAIFLDMTVSRDFCVFWRPLEANSKRS